MLDYLLSLDQEISQFLSSILPHSSFFDAIFRFLSAEGAYILVWPIVVSFAFLYEFAEHQDRKKFLMKIIRVSTVLFITSLVAFASVHYILKPIFKRARPNIVHSAPQLRGQDNVIPSGVEGSLSKRDLSTPVTGSRDYNEITIDDQSSIFTASQPPNANPPNIIPKAEFMGPAPYCPKDYSFPSGHAAIAWAGAYILVKFDSKRRREIVYCLVAAFVSFSRIYLSCHYFGDVLAGALYGILVGAVVFATYKRILLGKKYIN